MKNKNLYFIILILLLILIFFFSCAKWNSLEPYVQNNQTTQQSQYYFSGDNVSVDVEPEVKSTVKAQVKEPNESSYSSLETLTENNGKFTKTFSSTTNGDYNVKFIIMPEKAVEEEKVVQVRVYKNEQQRRQELWSYLATQTNSSSTTDGDILTLETNKNAVINGNPYNNDSRLGIYFGAGNKWFVVDVQGSKTDTFNATKSSDVESSVNYKGYRIIKPDENITNVIQGLKPTWPNQTSP